MNAVERVRKAFDETAQIEEAEFISGYNIALEDVQAELDKEVANDWETECMRLKREVDRLTEVYKKEYDLSSHHATTIMKQSEEIMQKDKELNELRAKWEVVELIFGGKVNG